MPAIVTLQEVDAIPATLNEILKMHTKMDKLTEKMGSDACFGTV